MKKAAVFALSLLCSSTLFGQYNYNFLTEVFFSRQPSARAEAMGRGYASIHGDLASSYFNPAGTARLKGVEIYGSTASPAYIFQDAQYSYASAGVNLGKYLTVGLSVNHFDYGFERNFIDTAGNQIAPPGRPENSIYSLNISSEPIKNWLFGVNANYLAWTPENTAFNTFYLDFGLIKILDLKGTADFNQSVNIGASIVNLNGAFLSGSVFGSNRGFDEALPVIGRAGASYQMGYQLGWITNKLETFNALAQFEYSFLFNSEYHTTIHTGAEVLFLEIVALRMGYYKESLYNYGRPESNEEQISAFTYGFGLQVPLDKLIDLPLQIRFDYTNMPQQNASRISRNFDNFNTYSLGLTWMFKRNA